MSDVTGSFVDEALRRKEAEDAKRKAAKGTLPFAEGGSPRGNRRQAPEEPRDPAPPRPVAGQGGPLPDVPSLSNPRPGGNK